MLYINFTEAAYNIDNKGTDRIFWRGGHKMCLHADCLRILLNTSVRVMLSCREPSIRA
jgi:hypothetical protein